MAHDVSTALALFLTRGTMLPFDWGRHDCALFVADWIAERRGFDPAEDLRGTYRTRRGCGRLLLRRGGLATVVAAALRRLSPTAEPVPGDVGIVETREGPAMGIFCGADRWACRAERGIVTVRLATPPKLVWAV